MLQNAKKYMIKNAIADRLTALVTIGAILFGMIPMQAVNAQTNEVVASTIPNTIINVPIVVTKDFPVSGDREARYVKIVVATSYSSDPRQTDSTPCLPAMNYDLCENAKNGQVNTIAANFLKLGTQVRFPDLYGDTIFVVRDRMNKRYNGKSRIDFYRAQLNEDGEVDNVASKQEAIAFGVKRLRMEVF